MKSSTLMIFRGTTTLGMRKGLKLILFFILCRHYTIMETVNDKHGINSQSLIKENDDNDTCCQPDISTMLSVKFKIEGLLYNTQAPLAKPPDLLQIHSMVLDYLHNNCKHEIIKDSIDVGIEKSQTIYYCKFCETCF
jgi:hypothetical protein